LEGAPEAAFAPDHIESWLVPFDPFSEAKFVHDSTPVTHGAIVGCANGFCWGSRSALLPQPICESDGLRLPCALVDEATLRKFANNDTALGSGEEFVVGDLFACRAYAEKGLYCVGASRDGLFGSSDACPPELSRAWPSSSGPIAAPHAACARSPVLVDRARRYSGVFGSASPSGFCLSVHRDDDWFPLCFGGISAPNADWEITVAPSERYSACTIDKAGKLYCWGEGYSRDAAGQEPIRIHRSLAQSSVAWEDKDPTQRNCAIRNNCGRRVRQLPPCAPDANGMTPSELVALGDGFEGTRVSVRGDLKLTQLLSSYSDMYCEPKGPEGRQGRCCSADADAYTLVTNGDESVALEGSWCHGDSSRICCSLPVLGQAVIARGVLIWREARRWGLPETWMLKDPELCEVATEPPFTRSKAPSWPAPSLLLR